LGEGRITIMKVDGREVDATVRGDSAMTYRVRHTDGSWTCTPCPSRTRCSHVQAVMLVTTSTPWRSANGLFAHQWANEPLQPWEQTAPRVPYRKDV
jgi:uncharacterized Zn finger protein